MELMLAFIALFGSVARGRRKALFADISRARELLDYQPRVGFEEGLRKTIEWHRSLETG